MKSRLVDTLLLCAYKEKKKNMHAFQDEQKVDSKLLEIASINAREDGNPKPLAF